MCYAPEKHADYQVAEKVNSPVKITNIKYSPSLIDSTDLDIQINRRSCFNVMKKLDFKNIVEKANWDAVRSFTKISDIDRTASHVMVSINFISFMIPLCCVTEINRTRQQQNMFFNVTTGPYLENLHIILIKIWSGPCRAPLLSIDVSSLSVFFNFRF